MYYGVVKVKILKDYRLLLTFDNNEERIFDMKDYLDHGIFQELKDEKMFNTAHVSFDTIEWKNGADLDPETLYEKSSKIKQPIM